MVGGGLNVSFCIYNMMIVVIVCVSVCVFGDFPRGACDVYALTVTLFL